MEISVVIPLYNKKESIIRTIDTALRQTHAPSEIIVVNDGSTDGSEELVLSLNHPLIKLISQNNSGVSAARNKGISAAKCKWIAFLDADDIWFEDYLEKIQQLQKDHKTAKILACSYFLENFKGERNNIVLNKLTFPNKFGLLENYFEVASCSHPPIWSSSVVVSKDALEKIGGFPVGVKSGEDLITWARLAVENKIAYCLEPSTVFVQAAAHTYDDKPNRVPEEPDYVGEALRQLKSGYPDTPFLKTYIAQWSKMRASIYLRLGIKGKAWNEIKKSLSFDAKNIRLYIYAVLLCLPTALTRKIFKSLAA